MTRSMHPLVTVTICDHYARFALSRRDDAGANGDEVRVMGLVYGTRKGACIDAVCALEVGTVEHGADAPCGGFDFDGARARAGLYAQTRGELEVVGYYRATATGALDDALDASLCRELNAREIVENAIVVLVPCEPWECAPGTVGLETKWYERIGVETSAGTSPDRFERCEYVVETFEAERIAVDEVSKIVPGSRDSHSARFGATLESAASATGALRDRLATIQRYLNDVKRGTSPCDYGLLREIAGAMKVLRANARDEFRTSFADEYEDTLALDYLASATKTTNELNEFIDKFQVVLSEQSANTRFQTRRNLG